ncbi:MAG: DEAD/DEAH box helicase [Thermogemmatispora sp.]|uniref:DEAD/DEAH box helicase n=1 Tax=Thermogemmatispora sp. TaxID=1968838 RepID=UPI0026297F9B|nr:DEAD/DEAH box helicase [Thermogemmatispora sp.]MBX5457151.1 DEAD/DEAH box helicase [Thermogemmatispora sp.]
MGKRNVEVDPEIQEEIEAFASRYPFPLDTFQKEAIAHLAQGRSVLVAAPTGTGKTLVAEYAIWKAWQQGARVIYTTPLKALSNQKFRDLRAIYGSEAVGLVTGDIVERSRAAIVIMTTEVYRNMLLEEGAEDGPSSLADVAYVVFDELHYLSDPERGPVWEEAIICSPPHVQLVGLSATVSNAQELADWISRVHRPVALVIHQERAVPLEHYYFLDGKLHLVQDAAGRRVERFPNVGGEARLARRYAFMRDWEGAEEEKEQEEKAASGTATSERPGATSVATATEAAISDRDQEKARSKQKRARPPFRRAPEPGEVLTALRDADLLPCLYFLPGRRAVEEAAMSAARHLFTTPQEQERIHEEIKVWLEQLPPEDRNLQQVHALVNLLPRGLAFHHAGLLPGLKVLVETLFAQGHLRAVFATDTLALGINMPARSVVVGSLSKFDGVEMRLLTPNEYRQLTGRAGRRGMDVHGAAVIPYSPWEPFEEAFARITDELHPVYSSFVIRYNSILNLWREGDIEHLRRICASSLREYQRYRAWEEQGLRFIQQVERQLRKGRKVSARKLKAAEEMARSLERSQRRRGQLQLSREGKEELEGTVFMLRALGYIGHDDRLTLRGRLLRSIFHPAGILIVELIMDGILDELTPAELAEVCSWFTFDNDRRLYNRHVLNSRLKEVRRELKQVEKRVCEMEEMAGLSLTPRIVPEFHGVALSWARGMSLNGLLRRIDLAEGDILMLLNQTIDLLQQVQGAIGQLLDARDLWSAVLSWPNDGAGLSRNTLKQVRRQLAELQEQHERLSRLRPLFAQASALLMRGIILQSRTVPSMVARINGEELPLDAEEDSDPHEALQDLIEEA